MISDKKLREWIRHEWDCCVSNGECSAHWSYDESKQEMVRQTHCSHVKSRGAGGSDLEAVCKCRFHHGAWHDLGRETFERRYPGKVKEQWIEILTQALDIFPEYSEEINELLERIG